MKNTFGNNLQVTLFGESHGPYIGCVLDGLAPGIKIDETFINYQLELRRPAGKISTSRVEEDQFQIISGVYNGYTTGTPLCIIIPNSVQHSKDYSKTVELARPGHADYTAECKYHGFQDYRGGGHFSGRITAALVAAGGIIIPSLANKGIHIGTHIKSCSNITDKPFSNDEKQLLEQITQLNKLKIALLDVKKEEVLKSQIAKIAEEGDSTGGVLETAIVGLPAGIGEPWFDSIESVLSHALFSIPAVKGVQFGEAFNLVNGKGSEYNDAFRIEENRIVTKTNHNAGINGGITNGMPVLFSCAIKPTPSIYKTQSTVNFKSKENAELTIEGRHDPAIIHRARVVVDSITAIVMYDVLSGRFGTDYFTSK